MTFTVGQTVVHPFHGLGEVQDITIQEVLGQTLRMASCVFNEGKLELSLNLDSVATPIRPVVGEEEVGQVMEHLKRCSPDSLSNSFNQRYNRLLEQVKTGCIYQLCEVVVALLEREERRSGLARKESQLLQRTLSQLARELAFVCRCRAGDLVDIIKNACLERRQAVAA